MALICLADSLAFASVEGRGHITQGRGGEGRPSSRFTVVLALQLPPRAAPFASIVPCSFHWIHLGAFFAALALLPCILALFSSFPLICGVSVHSISLGSGQVSEREREWTEKRPFQCCRFLVGCCGVRAGSGAPIREVRRFWWHSFPMSLVSSRSRSLSL